MPLIDLDDLVFKDPTFHDGVVLKKCEDLEKKAFSFSDFDFRVPSKAPGESHPIVLNEAFYAEKYPGLPKNAAFALCLAGRGMKTKQIRSEWKKAQKRMIVTHGIKLITFD